jgi:hypothetical protein
MPAAPPPLTVQLLTLKSLDDQRASRGNDRDGGLTVLDSQLDGDTETLPVTSGLGNVFSDLLGGLCNVSFKSVDVRRL